MPEPTSTTGAGGAALVAIAASLVGHKYGPLATVAVAALIGAFISLGEVGTTGRLAGLRYLALYTGAASVTAGSLSYLLGRLTHVDATEMLVLVAFCIGWIGGRWQGVLNAALAAAQQLLGRQGAGGKARR
jgi:hypothetical protein